MPAAIGVLLGGPLVLGAGTSALTVLAFASGSSILATPLIGLGLSLGLNVAATALFKPKVPEFSPQPVAQPEDGKVNLRQPVPSRRRIYGRGRYGGDTFFFQDGGGIAWQGFVVAAHEIEGFVEHWLHDEATVINVSGVVTSPTHFDTNVTIITRDGLSTENPYHQLIAAFPTLWTLSHRGDNLASVLVQTNTVAAESFRTTFPQGLPAWNGIVDGLKIYDPRPGAGQSAGDGGTWTFIKNPALVILDYLRNESGFRIAIDDIETSDFVTAADICDESVGVKGGGTEPRYQAAGSHRYDNAPKSVLAAMEAACDGRVYIKSNGKVGFFVGKYYTPTVSIGDDDIISCVVSSNTRLTETIIEQRAKYTSPLHDYSTVEALAWPRQDSDSIIGGEQPRNSTADLSWVQSYNQARRLMKRLFLRTNADLTGTVITKLKGLEALDERYLNLTCTAQQIVNQPIEIEDIKFDPGSMTVAIQWRTIDPNIDDWDPDVEAGTSPVVPVVIPKSTMAIPANLAAVNNTEIIVGGGTGAYAAISWDAAVSVLFTHEIEYSETPSGTVTSIATNAGEVTARTPTLADGTEYRFRIRAIGSGGAFSDWTSYVTMTAISDGTAPAIPVNLTATGDTPTPGDAQITWDSPSSSNYASANIYRHTSDDSGAATLAGNLVGLPSSSFSFDDESLAADDYWYWVASVNGSDVESARTATTPASVTVT